MLDFFKIGLNLFFLVEWTKFFQLQNEGFALIIFMREKRGNLYE